jgi:hypothetical protein
MQYSKQYGMHAVEYEASGYDARIYDQATLNFYAPWSKPYPIHFTGITE